jgi:hypothetical protein
MYNPVDDARCVVDDDDDDDDDDEVRLINDGRCTNE